MIAVLGILAVGASAPSADPPGNWATAAIVMGSLVGTFFLTVRVVQWIEVRRQLKRWLEELTTPERRP